MALLVILSLVLLTTVPTGAQTSPPTDSGGVAGGDLQFPGDAVLREQIAGSEETGEIDLLPEEEGGSETQDRWRVGLRSRLAGSLQAGRGYGDGRYAGSVLRALNRLLVTGGDRISAGLLAEKDPGERSMADHLSGSVALHWTRSLPGAVIGDFRVRGGQGLVFPGARRYGKGSDVITPAMRSGWGINASPTADESHFFRGLALTIAPGPFALAAFVSRRHRSATVSDDGTISSLGESGYHRTAAEIGNRDRVLQRSRGFIVRFDAEGALAVGLNMLEEVFSPVGGVVAVRERRMSLDVLVHGPVTIFGEIAAGPRGPSILGGVRYGDGRYFRVVLSGRSYPPGEGLSYVAAFGDRAVAADERGVYAGMELRPGSGVTLYGYADLFTSGGPSRDAYFPRRGADRIIGAVMQWDRRFEFRARFRARDLERKTVIPGAAGLLLPGNAAAAEHSWRLELHWKAGHSVGAGARLDGTRVPSGTGPGEEGGLMFVADLSAGTPRGLAVKFRAILFGTDSYASRLYETEPGLPGSLATVALYGRGTRWYVLPSWMISGGWRLSAVFSRTVFAGRKSIGSGPGEFPGNIWEHAGVQLDVDM